MTVAHDAAIEATWVHTDADPFTFSHTPTGTPRGVLLFVGSDTTGATIVANVTYGGVLMQEIVFAQDLAGEPGQMHVYFLGKGVPTGMQTVSIDHVSGTTANRWAVCITVTAADDVKPIAWDGASGDVAVVQLALDSGAFTALRYCGIFSGHDDISSLALLTDQTAVHNHDFGTVVARVDRQTTAGSGSFTTGYTATDNDAAMVAIALIDATNTAWLTPLASNDDAQQLGTTVTINGVDIGGSLDAITEWVGVRFPVCPIPQGSTIDLATFYGAPTSTSQDEPLVSVFFEDVDDAAVFTTAASSISSRGMTGSIAWDNADLGLATGMLKLFGSPDLASILQTVVDRVGYAEDNDVAVIIQGGATSTRDLTLIAWDATASRLFAGLFVQWTPAAGGISIPVVYHHRNRNN